MAWQARPASSSRASAWQARRREVVGWAKRVQRANLSTRESESVPTIGGVLVKVGTAQARLCPPYETSILLLLAVLLFGLAVVFSAVGEARIAETSADGEHAPALDILHERHFGQPLHHAVIVRQPRGVVVADHRDRLDETRRQIELAALPVARQVLRALLD